MFYLEPMKSVARRAREMVLEAMGTGLLDEDDDTLEAGLEKVIEQAIQTRQPDFWNPCWDI